MSTSPSRRSLSSRPSESGVALLAAVLLLLMLASIGLASLNVVQGDEQVAGYLNRKAVALHAADAAVARALDTMAVNGTPTVPATAMGDATLYPNGQPSYRTDTTTGTPIQKAGTGSLTGYGLTGGQGGSGAQFGVQYWKIRVEGDAPGGSVARVEVLTGAMIAN